MPIDTYNLQAPQDASESEVDSLTAPGYSVRPDFELQQNSFNAAPRDLMERDFHEAVMNDEDRRAAENAWDLQETERLDLEMFDKMNKEQTARSQVADVRHESYERSPGVTEDMVRAMTITEMIDRNSKISQAIGSKRHQTLNY